MTDYKNIYEEYSNAKDVYNKFTCKFCKNDLSTKHTFQEHNKKCPIKLHVYKNMNILNILNEIEFEDNEEFDLLIECRPDLIKNYKLRYEFLSYFLDNLDFIQIDFKTLRQRFDYLIKNYEAGLEDALVYFFPVITRELCKCFNQLENNKKNNIPILLTKKQLEYIKYMYLLIKQKYLYSENEKFRNIIIDTVYDNLENKYYGEYIINLGFFDDNIDYDRIPKKNYYYMYLLDSRKRTPTEKYSSFNHYMLKYTNNRTKYLTDSNIKIPPKEVEFVPYIKYIYKESKDIVENNVDYILATYNLESDINRELYVYFKKHYSDNSSKQIIYIQLHREEDKPAIFSKDGSLEIWAKENCMHRANDKPAYIFKSVADGEIIKEYWVRGLKTSKKEDKK